MWFKKLYNFLRYKVLKFIVDQIATPRLTDTGSRRLPDSPMRGVGESTKGKIKACTAPSLHTVVGVPAIVHK